MIGHEGKEGKQREEGQLRQTRKKHKMKTNQIMIEIITKCRNSEKESDILEGYGTEGETRVKT